MPGSNSDSPRPSESADLNDASLQTGPSRMLIPVIPVESNISQTHDEEESGSGDDVRLLQMSEADRAMLGHRRRPRNSAGPSQHIYQIVFAGEGDAESVILTEEEDNEEEDDEEEDDEEEEGEEELDVEDGQALRESPEGYDDAQDASAGLPDGGLPDARNNDGRYVLPLPTRHPFPEGWREHGNAFLQNDSVDMRIAEQLGRSIAFGDSNYQRPGAVYLFEDAEGQMYAAKCGMAYSAVCLDDDSALHWDFVLQAVKRRLLWMKHRCKMPNVTRVHIWGPSRHYARLERLVHRTLSHYRCLLRCVCKRDITHGEWFNAPKRLMISTINFWDRFLQLHPYGRLGDLSVNEQAEPDPRLLKRVGIISTWPDAHLKQKVDVPLRLARWGKLLGMPGHVAPEDEYFHQGGDTNENDELRVPAAIHRWTGALAALDELLDPLRKPLVDADVDHASRGYKNDGFVADDDDGMEEGLSTASFVNDTSSQSSGQADDEDNGWPSSTSGSDDADQPDETPSPRAQRAERRSADKNAANHDSGSTASCGSGSRGQPAVQAGPSRKRKHTGEPAASAPKRHKPRSLAASSPTHQQPDLGQRDIVRDGPSRRTRNADKRPVAVSLVPHHQLSQLYELCRQYMFCCRGILVQPLARRSLDRRGNKICEKIVWRIILNFRNALRDSDFDIYPRLVQRMEDAVWDQHSYPALDRQADEAREVLAELEQRLLSIPDERGDLHVEGFSVARLASLVRSVQAGLEVVDSITPGQLDSWRMENTAPANAHDDSLHNRQLESWRMDATAPPNAHDDTLGHGWHWEFVSHGDGSSEQLAQVNLGNSEHLPGISHPTAEDVYRVRLRMRREGRGLGVTDGIDIVQVPGLNIATPARDQRVQQGSSSVDSTPTQQAPTSAQQGSSSVHSIPSQVTSSRSARQERSSIFSTPTRRAGSSQWAQTTPATTLSEEEIDQLQDTIRADYQAELDAVGARNAVSGNGFQAYMDDVDDDEDDADS